jgi:hypothetical protein
MGKAIAASVYDLKGELVQKAATQSEILLSIITIARQMKYSS